MVNHVNPDGWMQGYLDWKVRTNADITLEWSVRLFRRHDATIRMGRLHARDSRDPPSVDKYILTRAAIYRVRLSFIGVGVGDMRAADIYDVIYFSRKRRKYITKPVSMYLWREVCLDIN